MNQRATEVLPDEVLRDLRQDPFTAYRRLREEHPVAEHPRLGWLVSRHRDVVQVLTDPAFSTHAYARHLEPVLGRTILQMEGQEHADHRRVISGALRGRTLHAELEPRIAEAAHSLVARFSGDGRTDLVESFCRLLPVRVILGVLGLPQAEHRRFQRWYSTFGPFMAGHDDPEVAAAGLRARDEMRAYFDGVIAERRAHPGTDLVSRMCAARVDGAPLSADVVRNFCALLLSAGAETTDKALSSLVSLLLDHPDQLDAVRADRSLIPAALAETLRHSPPTHMVFREAEQDVVLSGVTVPAGAQVVCLLGAAGRDPERYAEPDRFDVARGDLDPDRAFGAGAGHVALGLGRHFCVGAALAKAEVEIGLSALLDALPDLRYADGFSLRRAGVLAHAPTRLLVEFSPLSDR
ncbi:cytochrome P450 [Streptomyces solincola]|uniref:Cytochrome P450 n=1 Tax=Streptomyces solincola TaxID=2100817 RepID=A0A2S9Q1V2_9ACTN|nr:cytochrome P450 [Streptomyces solincola]PRH80660.1 cytochrome P450 [Streptomyces solincola]